MNASGYDQYFELAAAGDVDTFLLRLARVAEQVGFPLVNATAIVARTGERPVLMRETRIMPAGWEKMVGDPDDCARDPCIAHLKRDPRPLFYDRDFYERHGTGDLWEKQAPFGYRSGILAIVHLPLGRHFQIGFDREEALPKDQQRLMRMLADLQFLTLFVQNKAFQLLLADEGASDAGLLAPRALSARELEVLKWASAGKTAWETGVILSISEHTVNKHIAAAARQLGCVGGSKAQAVARAFEQGLL